MANPAVNLTIRDGGLGLADGNDTGTPALIGACSLGTPNTVYSFSDPQTMRDALGTGPLAELAAYVLDVAGGPVVCVPVTATTSAAGAVTATATGTATLAVTGNALDTYDVRVRITQGGATLVAGDAVFQYSLDGGRTWSAEISVPTSGVYVIPNTGLTLTWTYATGTAFVVGDSWAFTTAQPSYSLANGLTALQALLADATVDFFLVHLVGPAASAADAATMFAAVESAMLGAANTNYRYARAIIETPADTDAALKTAFANSAGRRMAVSGRGAYIISKLSGSAVLRPVAWMLTAWAAAHGPHEDPGKVRNGPIPGVLALSGDEGKTPGLDAAGFVTATTHVGKRGFYLTQGRMMSAPGSDFKYLQYGRVVDIACRTIRAAQLDYLNDEVVVRKDNGRILETSARDIEQNIEAQVRTAVTEPGYASSVSVQVDRTINVLSTQKLVVRYRIVPLAYAKTIEGEIALENPALRAV